MNVLAYWRLARFHRPAGIFLLWCPTAWALWLANKGHPPLHLVLLFALGTILMRAAGCVINDIADRQVDLHVARTKSRPLTSGELRLEGAFLFLFLLLTAALFILLALPQNCFVPALLALGITIIYPFCKRFLEAPQLVLGLAFSMGIPMAYLASGAAFDAEFYLLCLINFSWIVAYDTMYAMADRAEDLRIGVKSTAILLGDYDCFVIGLLQSLLHGLWLTWGLVTQANLWFYACWFLAAGLIAYQQTLIRHRIAADCFKAFQISLYYGLLIWLGLILN